MNDWEKIGYTDSSIGPVADQADSSYEDHVDILVRSQVDALLAGEKEFSPSFLAFMVYNELVRQTQDRPEDLPVYVMSLCLDVAVAIRRLAAMEFEHRDGRGYKNTVEMPEL